MTTQTAAAKHDYQPNDKPAPRFHDAPLCAVCGAHRLASQHDTAAVTTTWHHAKKGLITGVLLRIDRGYAEVRLTQDHQLPYTAPGNVGRIDRAGTTLTLDTRYMTETAAPRA